MESEKLVAKIFGIFICKQVSYKEFGFVQTTKIMRLAIDGRKPLVLWLAKTRPKFIRANSEWLTIWQAKHSILAKIYIRY